jgi:SpoIIAA-like
MSMTMQHERENVYRLEIRGTLQKKDLDRCQEALASEMARIGPVKLLFVLAGFEGWEPHAAWNDLTFYVKHGDTIERIAIVGEERWRGDALMFAGADLRRAPVEFFRPEAVADARAWLSAGSPPAAPRP